MGVAPTGSPMISLSWVPMPRRFRRAFSIKSSVFQRNRRISRTLLRCNVTGEIECNHDNEVRKEEIKKTTGLISKARTLDGNGIVALISEIGVSSIAIIPTSVSSEIPIERLINS